MSIHAPAMTGGASPAQQAFEANVAAVTRDYQVEPRMGA